MQTAEVSLDDKYRLQRGVALMTGIQALVRLPLEQSRRDRAAGLRTGGYISGYRGSPLGGYDRELWRARELLDAHGVLFRPGLNEDLAATAVWGTQQVGLFPSDYDGVFALWYGKGPGVERSGDPLKHGNYAGSSKSGGVLVVVGDDPAAKSSTIVQQSEFSLAAHCIPVLYPANVGEILEYGLIGWALSRYCGLWVGLKCVNETLETDLTVPIVEGGPAIVAPEAGSLPPGGVHYSGVYSPTRDEALVVGYRLPLARRFCKANHLNHAVYATPQARIGIVCAGKTFSDVEYALRLLGIDADRARKLQLDIYKIGMIWPLEESGLREFAINLQELFVVEEKRPFIEPQVANTLYGSSPRPRIIGKLDERGKPLLPIGGGLTPTTVAVAIAERLEACGLADAALRERVAELRHRLLRCPSPVLPDRPTAADMAGGDIRTPYFCSGCPHNTSTRVPEGSQAFGGIGCHTMAVRMGRNTLPPTQMGGEGANWMGIEPFVKVKHIFQNLGDGTYFHSGLMAIRAAVASQSNITYKILYNDVVAMTGGQPIDGELSVADMATQVLAEGIARCVVVTSHPEAYRKEGALPGGVTVYHRDKLDSVQRNLREVHGVTVLIYEQMCAAEKRRQIKRKLLPPPTQRVFINESVCEGCGDCSSKSNCVSVLPKETPLGRKRMIDQSSCNEDLSCIKGFCPSFVLVRNAVPRRPSAPKVATSERANLPQPPRISAPGSNYNVIITGIGGSGVITVGAVLAMAARLDGKGASTYNMTGLAQKNGPVYSHLRFTDSPQSAQPLRIDVADADLIIACDVLAALAPEALQTLREDHTWAVINTGVEPTAAFQLFRDSPIPGAAACEKLAKAVGHERVGEVNATEQARTLLGDKIAANMLMVGFAYQKGLLPLSIEALERAIELNGVSVESNKRALQIGRQAAAGEAIEPRIAEAANVAAQVPANGDLEQVLDVGRRLLTDYQDSDYAARYEERVRSVARTEQQKAPGKAGLALAVARNYRKLLAYKDEYEVARLYSQPSFRNALHEAFAGKPRLSLLLAPPALGGRRDADGNPIKREFGPWIFGVLRVLARLKGLRGTVFDPFGYSTERRMERALVAEYESWIDELAAGLSPQNHELALRIAALPDPIRGFGQLKLRAVTVAREAAGRLLGEFRGSSRTDTMVEKPPAAAGPSGA